MTMTMTSELLEVWERLEATAGSSSADCWTRMHPGSMVDLAAIILKEGMRVGVRLCVRASAIAPATSLVVTDGFTLRARTEDGATRLTLVLELPAFREVFAVMCEDILARAAEASSEQAAVQILLNRLATWKRLFVGRGPRPLTEREQLGLYAEIEVLEQLLTTCPAGGLLAAWKGPDRALHDYDFGPLHLEIKAGGHGNGSIVRVRSLDQLDPGSAERLMLWQVVLSMANDGRTLASLVQEVGRLFLGHGIDIGRVFEDRLIRAGYLNLHRAAYDYQPLRRVSQRIMEVNAAFPGLSRSSVSSAIHEASYDLDVAQVPSAFTIGDLEAMLDVHRALACVRG